MNMQGFMGEHRPGPVPGPDWNVAARNSPGTAGIPPLMNPANKNFGGVLVAVPPAGIQPAPPTVYGGAAANYQQAPPPQTQHMQPNLPSMHPWGAPAFSQRVSLHGPPQAWQWGQPHLLHPRGPPGRPISQQALLQQQNSHGTFSEIQPSGGNLRRKMATNSKEEEKGEGSFVGMIRRPMYRAVVVRTPSTPATIIRISNSENYVYRLHKRRLSCHLREEEKWYCPHGCGKFYRKSSTVSIRTHKEKCPLIPAPSSTTIPEINNFEVNFGGDKLKDEKIV
mmetsp:Transcript_15003/g.27002  ORF Transcript_15003/g.27002 Transcript_15003/m.27002 type:complete len:280 (+) Transcript_15003:104-943(+)|eukprot:CAMPEP_0197517038 /NCGR_PEP_ID=MMETSP1318-20131121/2000_1 /TAXON_ID=552666 /ORGANISM="Partenskyella glossopodia, Strain RCC365" /LENGTH=279 /DNA_ID=CAMNT_0043066271 /DNA_START=85 /DNA_END=924 /DNA_ORIENTATION=-